MSEQAAIGQTLGNASETAATSLLKVTAERHARFSGLIGRVTSAKALDVELVHDLRVASRRLGEAAAILAAVMDKPTSRLVQEALKAFRQAAGELRDLDVMCEHLEKSRGKWSMPAPLRKLATAVSGELHAKRGALEGKLAEAAASISLTGAMIMLAKTIEEYAKSSNTEGRLKATIEKRAARREKQLAKALGEAAKKQTAMALHEARIAAKKLRYVLEVEEDGGVQKHKKELRFLKRMQELLGDHHDVQVLLEELAGRVKARARKIRGLSPAFRRWHRKKQKEQAHRAAVFFIQSYVWRNRPAASHGAHLPIAPAP